MAKAQCQSVGYADDVLLASAQSVLVLTVLVLLDELEESLLSTSASSQLLVDIWDQKARVARCGLIISEESSHTLPAWERWAFCEARRRTIKGLNHLEWAWSLLRGYPVLTCFELGPLPAPSPGYLWRAQNEKLWKGRYAEWMRAWPDGGYRMAEFFYIQPHGQLDSRTELWLSEADEYGMLLMAEGAYFQAALQIENLTCAVNANGVLI